MSERHHFKLETLISYILIIGVIISLILTLAGLILYSSQGGLSIELNDPGMYIHGRDFFSFVGGLVRGGTGQFEGVFLIVLGLVILILTPYIRVISSFIYFGVIKDIKYLIMTLFVLIVLTVSLALH